MKLITNLKQRMNLHKMYWFLGVWDGDNDKDNHEELDKTNDQAETDMLEGQFENNLSIN